jgi:RecA/RadA recombinase
MNIQLLMKVQPNADFMTAAELAEIRKRCFRISTGSKQLDQILNGYISSASLNESAMTIF